MISNTSIEQQPWLGTANRTIQRCCRTAIVAAFLLSCAEGRAAGVEATQRIAFRAIPTGSESSNRRATIYIGVKNIGDHLLRILPRETAAVWGYHLTGQKGTRKEKRDSTGVVTRTGTLTGAVSSSSGPVPRESYCPDSDAFLLALAKGNEVFLESTVDVSLLNSGVHDVVLNVVMLVVEGESGCGPTSSERGLAPARLTVRGERAAFVGPVQPEKQEK